MPAPLPHPRPNPSPGAPVLDRAAMLAGVLRFTLAGHDLDMAADTDTAGQVVAVSGLAVPWDTPAVRFGVPVIFTRDTTRVPDDLSTVKLLIGHDDDRPAGYATAAVMADDGLRMSFAVDAEHPRSAELLREIDLKWRDGLSVGVELDTETVDAIWDAMWEEGDGDPVPLAGIVREVSAVAVPQFNAARVGASAAPVLARFATTTTTEEGSPMPAPTLAAAAAAPLEAPPAPPAFTFSPAELAAELAPYLGATTAAHPLARFGSAADFIMAAREGSATEAELAAFALADQVTGDNPGVVPPTWLQVIVGILDRGRPTVSAFGGPSSAGDSGLTVHWPYYDGGFDDLVDVQATEKTEVTTRKVSIKDASATLATYAGASDISYQLLRRSSPSYREAYTRILNIGYAVTTDAAFAAQVLAVAVPATGAPAWATDDDLQTLLTALFAASSQVDDAVGTPADVVLASPDMFAAIGVLTGLVPAPYGTSNVGGTSDAATLRVNVSGLNVTKDRSLPPATLLVGSRGAATWTEDGPFPVQADDVPKLGLDVGVWGMGVGRVTVPTGIVKVGGPVVPLAAGRKSSS